MRMDRLLHYITELPLLKKIVEDIKKQQEQIEEIGTLNSKIKKLKSERDIKINEIKTFKTELEVLKMYAEALKK